MEEQKINIKRFFIDNDFANYIELSQEEAEVLKHFETVIFYGEGFANDSGGFAYVELHDIDEEDKDTLLGVIKCGSQSEYVRQIYTDAITFDRLTLEINYA